MASVTGVGGAQGGGGGDGGAQGGDAGAQGGDSGDGGDTGAQGGDRGAHRSCGSLYPLLSVSSSSLQLLLLGAFFLGFDLLLCEISRSSRASES